MSMLMRYLLPLCLVPLALADTPIASVEVPSGFDGSKLSAEVTYGVYINDASDSAGPVAGIGLGYRVGNGAVLVQGRRYANLTGVIASAFVSSFDCAVSRTCQTEVENLTGINLLYRARPIRWLSYGLGVGTMRSTIKIEEGSTNANGDFVVSKRRDIKRSRTTLPYELLLNFGPAPRADRHPWSIYLGLQGQVCKDLCSQGLYVGFQTGI